MTSDEWASATARRLVGVRLATQGLLEEAISFRAEVDRVLSDFAAAPDLTGERFSSLLNELTTMVKALAIFFAASQSRGAVKIGPAETLGQILELRDKYMQLDPLNQARVDEQIRKLGLLG